MKVLSVLLALRGEMEEDFLRRAEGHRQVVVTRRCADSAEALAGVLAGVGDVVVIDSQLGVDRSLVHRLCAAGAAVVILAPQEQHAGLREVGAQPVLGGPGELLDAVLSTLDQPRAAVPAAVPQEIRAQNVIAVMSPWGSPGRTTVAVSLAAELAVRGGRPLLIDADLWGASIKQYLGLDPDGAGLATALRGVERATMDLDGLVRLTEEREGMRVLGGVNKSDRWREVSGPLLEKFWELVHTWPGYVVIDAPVRLPTGGEEQIDRFGPSPNDLWDSIRDAAKEMCLVGSADAVGIHRFVNFHLDGLLPEVRPVINRVRGSAGGPKADESIRELLARFAGIEDPLLIPEDDAVDRAMLEGVPLLASATRSPARVAVMELADHFLPLAQRSTRVRRRRNRRNGGD